MFPATGFYIVLATVRVQHGHGNECEQIKTESGTGCEPDPLRFPIVTTKTTQHISEVYHKWEMKSITICTQGAKMGV